MATVSQESIYNLIPPQVEPARKEDIYVSIHHEKAVDERKEGKLPSRSMGAAKVTPNDPEHFLVKGTRELRDEALCKSMPRDPSSSNFRGDGAKRKDPVPNRFTQSVVGPPSDIDYIRQNQLEAILTQSKKQIPAERSYRKKPDYGKKPQYMFKMEAKKREEQEQEEAFQQKLQEVEAQRTRLLGDEEKESLLAGLKLQWARVNKEFQMLSLALDEMNKRRKEKLTAQLTMLEKDIALIQKPQVYVKTY